jgi:polyhydroxybutyrate depolymerase
MDLNPMIDQKRAYLLKLIVSMVCLLVVLSACVRTVDDRFERDTGQKEYEGYLRDYVLVRPSVLEPGELYPLVLALHGGGGDGERMCRLRGGIQEFAAQGGYFVLCPSGLDRHWNDGRQIDRWRAHAEDIDDVGFLLELLDDITAQYPVDHDRLFVTGMSNGGKMSLRLACEATRTFSAAAPVIASMPADLECEPTKPISILIMNGTEDPLVPWEGGKVGALGRPLGEALSTPATVSFWVEENQCKSSPAVSSIPDINRTDRSSITLEVHADCLDAVQVSLYTVEGGGHTWPGGAQYLPKILIGRTNQDAHAGALIWEFFEQVMH